MKNMQLIDVRENIDEKYKWDIYKFYENDEIWESDFKNLKTLLPSVNEYTGKLDYSKDILREFIILKESIITKASRLYTYAKMRWDENTKDNKYKSLFERAQNIYSEVETTLSFSEPEMVEKIDIILGFSMLDNKLKEYKRYFDKLAADKQHILSAKEESIIAEASILMHGPENIFSVLNDADLPFPVIKDENKHDIQLSHSRYSKLIESYNRDVRLAAFDGMYSTYKMYENTFASILNAHLKSDVFYTKVRKYNNTLEAALKPNEIPTKVYDNLINVVNTAIPTLQKYLQYRKNTLNIGDIHMYDLYVPIVPDVKYEITFDEAKDILIEAFRPLGEDYIDAIKMSFEQRWIDVYENEGKRSGAYSWGSYDTYPYILMNFQNNLNSLFTLAHELGHSIHSYYSKKEQPFATSNYVIFVAEVASTVNETLLFQYLLNKSDDINFKAYLINYFIEGFRTTVFRQTMFAEFEKTIHSIIESGNSLTSAQLSDIYYNLNLKYYSPVVSVDKQIEVEWARIPHFYYNYYVYQYATGFISAQTLVKQIITNPQKYVSRYIQFLGSGSSKDPISLLKDAGVDMTTNAPYIDGFNIFDEYVEKLINNNF